MSVEMLRQTYSAFNARDLDSALAQMHPEVVWPNGMEGGVVRGRSGIREYWSRQWAVIDPHVEPVGFAPDDTGRILVTVHQTVRDLQGTVLLDRMVEHLYTFKDGLILGMEIREPGIQAA